MLIRTSALCLGLLAAVAAWPASAAPWKEFNYYNLLTMSFPGTPNVKNGVYKTAEGLSVPSSTYTVKDDGVVYTLTVADFADTSISHDDVLADAAKMYGARGKITMNEQEQVDQEYGRLMRLSGKDGSLSSIVVLFAQNRRLYLVEGKALPPYPEDRSSGPSRMRWTLHFVGQKPAGAGKIARIDAPNEAYEACKFKDVGDIVQYTAAGKVMTGACEHAPQGMVVVSATAVPSTSAAQ